MRRPWEVDEFSQIESTVIAELIESFTEMEGDLSGFEIIGRFPTSAESIALGVSLPTPVWLKSANINKPENDDYRMISEDFQSKLCRLRNELS